MATWDAPKDGAEQKVLSKEEQVRHPWRGLGQDGSATSPAQPMVSLAGDWLIQLGIKFQQLNRGYTNYVLDQHARGIPMDHGQADQPSQVHGCTSQQSGAGFGRFCVTI